MPMGLCQVGSDLVYGDGPAVLCMASVHGWCMALVHGVLMVHVFRGLLVSGWWIGGVGPKHWGLD